MIFRSHVRNQTVLTLPDPPGMSRMVNDTAVTVLRIFPQHVFHPDVDGRVIVGLLAIGTLRGSAVQRAFRLRKPKTDKCNRQY